MTAPARIYNCTPDQYDPRDFRVSAPPPPLRALPPRVDLHGMGVVPEIWNQGQLGSCTGHGGGRVHEIERRRQGYAARMPSRLALYYFERDLEGDVAQDGGAQIRTCIKAMAQYGVPEESLWPYDVAQFQHKPTPAAYAEAAEHQVTRYTKLDASPEAICAALAAGRPVVFGFTVFSSFESAETATTGDMPMPAKGERNLGGHCVAATGYVITGSGAPRTGPFAWLLNRLLGAPKVDGYLLCDNSWGAAWGDKGRFRMPFAFVRAGNLFDPWTVDAVEA